RSYGDWSSDVCSSDLAPLLVAEILGDGERGEAHAGASAGRLVHLPVDQHALTLLQVLEVDDLRLDELGVEVVALAGALSHAAEDGEATALLGDVVDQLLEEHGLAHAGAAEEADLAAAKIGREQVDDLDAGLERDHPHVLLQELRRVAVDGQPARGADGALLVYRLAD